MNISHISSVSAPVLLYPAGQDFCTGVGRGGRRRTSCDKSSTSSLGVGEKSGKESRSLSTGGVKQTGDTGHLCRSFRINYD